MIVEAALALLDVAYHRRLVLVPGLVPGLVSALSRGHCEATAAAWALGWVRISAETSGWQPSADELKDLADAMASGRLPPQAVSFLLWCFNKAPMPQRDDMAAAVMDAYVSAAESTQIEIGHKYCILFPQTAEPVVKATLHQRESVRRAASILLAQLDGSLAMQPLLKALTREDGTPHHDVVEVLGRLGDPRAVEPLLDILTTPDGDLNLTVVAALGTLHDSRAVQPLLDVLAQTSGPTRATVVQALGQLRDPRAVEPLLDMLTPTRSRVDPVVAQALGTLRDPRAVDPLLGTLSVGNVVPHRAAVQALGRLGDRKAVEPLLAVFRRVGDSSNPDDDLLLTIAEALVVIGDPRAAQTLSELRSEQSQEVHSRVMAARATLGDTAARDTLREGMGDDIEEKRRAALWSLAALEGDEVDRTLLSRDYDGVAPGIDPESEIEESSLPKYATAVRLPLQQVRSRYEQLADRYPLKLSWHPTPT